MTGDKQPRVLVLEDEPDLCEAMVSYLQAEQMAAHGAGSLRQADAWCEAHAFDVLVLDLGLPDGDGLEWLGRSVRVSDKGVIIMTARGLPTQRLSGLKAGADAYLVKPVPMEELAWHVRNLFARLRPAAAGDSPALPADGRRWQLHSQTWSLVSPSGRPLKLKHAERLLVQALLQAGGEVLNKQQVVQSLGGHPDSYDWRRIETLVRRLRVRCRETLDEELPIKSIYGQGLAFVEPGAVVVGAPA